MDDLRWLGIDWDEGPDCGGPFAPYEQSKRGALYESALDRLLAAERIFPCARSRRDLEGIASAPHGSTSSPYPSELRPRTTETRWLERIRADRGLDAAVRFAVAGGEIVFSDRVLGERREDVSRSVGDFVVRRRDGVFAYQLAVVADDIAMEIDEVVRGADLVDSTARQIQLIDALGGKRPAYAHVPLVVNARGEKLSKRDDATTLRSLREAGVSPEKVTGYLAYSLGLLATPLPTPAAALVTRFSWDALRASELVLPGDVAALLKTF
jgi:glutamyl-tRNA synthetase